MEKRKILIYLAIICNGQWDEIYDTLHRKDYEVDFDEAMSRGRMYSSFERHAHEDTCNLFKKEVE